MYIKISVAEPGKSVVSDKLVIDPCDRSISNLFTCFLYDGRISADGGFKFLLVSVVT